MLPPLQSGVCFLDGDEPSCTEEHERQAKDHPTSSFFEIFPPGGSVAKQMEVPTVADHGGIESILKSFIVVCSKKIKQ
jgi:hypothetical protein